LHFLLLSCACRASANPQASLDEIHRVLKPGGQTLILDTRRDARRIFSWLLWLAQNIALRLIGQGALRRINEPTGSLLASYTLKEAEEMMTKTQFSHFNIEGKLGWMYIWAEKSLSETSH
jgi:ubiquinone/menaquinone biosynthesis C-methylase UbiE